MHALSVCQPYAEHIASGAKPIEYRSWQAPSVVGRDLLIVASKKTNYDDSYAGEPVGVAICVVRVIGMIRYEAQSYGWEVADPRRVEPEPIRGYAGLYRVDDARIRYVAAPSFRARARRSLTRAPIVDTPYTFSIGDAAIRGESATTPAKARQRARELAEKHGVTITISRDGIAIGGES